MRVAVTGAGGRLGNALIGALAEASFTGPSGPLAWGRTEFDLDAPEVIGALLDATRAELVIHAAAWTDVDGCARDPQLAMRRNGTATGILAAAAAVRGVDLLVISTNEVFDGTRAGHPYRPNDPTAPANPYGASKLAGERAALDAYTTPVGDARDGGGGRAMLGIARTAWLFGPGAPDFPVKIAQAAERALAAGQALRVVADEIGTPTYVGDVAEAVVELIGAGAVAGVHHLVNGGVASRAAWARDVLARLDISAEIVEIVQAEYPRASQPPRWGVLAPTALPGGEPIRPWTEAMAEYAPALRRSVTVAR